MPGIAQTEFPATVSLSSLDGKSGFLITGDAAGGRSGYSVSSAGDINADGIADLIIGAPYTSDYTGASYVVFGKAGIGSSGTLSLSNLNGSNGFKISGVAVFGESGYSVSSAGDINADGIVDLIIGAPYASSQAGVSYVVFGKAGIGSSGTLALSSLNGSNGFKITGIAAYAYSGWSVSSAGDINADGITDLIIGASEYQNYGGGNGASYVVFGKAGIGSSGTLALSSLKGNNGFNITNIRAGFYGWSATSAGDINADGIADLIIGVPDGLEISYVVFGKAEIGSSGTLALSSLNGSNGFKIPCFPGGQIGYSVSSAGDSNADGVADLIIGAPYTSDVGSTSGASYVVFGKTGIGSSGTLALSSLTGSNGFKIPGVLGSQNGHSVSGAGDINADGIADFIIGAPILSASYVVFGKAGIGGSGTLALSSLTGSNGFTITGIGGQSGASVSRAGDINADGIDDLIIGAPGISASSPGASYVVFGEAASSLLSNSLTITKGHTVVLNSQYLNATYPRNPVKDPTLLFTVSNVQHGVFSLVSNASMPITRFLQQQVRSGQIQFTHDNGLIAPFYTVQLGDGGLRALISPHPASITFIHQGGAITSNQLAISQGQAITLTASNLSAINLDNASDSPSLIFTVSNVQYGRFALAGNLGIAITSFTQLQRQDGSVQFVHDGSTNAPSYVVAVSDGGISTSPQAALISFNLPPVLVANTLALNQGQTVILTSSNLSAADADDNASSLIFIVSAVQHGQFEFVSNPGAAIASFTQGQVQNGAIQFVSDGSITAPSYTIAVSDSKVTTAAQSSTITFNIAPVLTTNTLTISQGETLVISNNNLVATDPQDNGVSLVFIVSNIQHGHFELVSNPGVAITSFTQGLVQVGSVQFVHDGSLNAPSYRVGVSDGRITIPAEISTVTFNPAPLLQTNNLSISQGKTAILTTSNLSATDTTVPAADLIFTASNVQYGHFELVNNPGVPITRFTQGNLQSGDVQFVAIGTHAASYSIAVSNGKVTTPPQASTVTFTLAPVLVNNHLTVNQGQTIILSSSMLSATDPNDPTSSLAASSLSFILSGISGGHFELVSSPGIAITSFTQAQIQSNVVRFVQDGSATVPRYSVAVSDGRTTTTSELSSVIFNAIPVITKNRLTLSQGQTLILTSDELSATDRETAAADLVFTASTVSHGQFEDINNLGTPVAKFPQSKITSGAIKFIPDGSSAAPAYNISVSDGSLNSSPSSAIVNFSAASDATNNTVRNAVIGASLSGAIGLGFFGVKFGINRCAENGLQAKLNRRAVHATGKLEKFYREIVEPVAKQLFDQIKTTNVIGYRNTKTTDAYLDAIEKIIMAVDSAGISLTRENFSKQERLRIIQEIVKQTKRFLVPHRNYCSTSYLCSFFQPDVEPKKMEESAGTIAKLVENGLRAKDPTGASRVSKNNRSTPIASDEHNEEELELKEVKSDSVATTELREEPGLVERFTLFESRIEKRLEDLESSIESVRREASTISLRSGIVESAPLLVP